MEKYVAAAKKSAPNKVSISLIKKARHESGGLFCFLNT